ncbi:unnamed protein product [Ilex paraguariensis]|uniref:Viral late gene transcription factor 3 zinc ribbon domain-containing protein n=1 Tax=Ilex paraguariensis TaxID=185542 RepID=A0ABC8T3I2_9AQUA
MEASMSLSVVPVSPRSKCESRSVVLDHSKSGVINLIPGRNRTNYVTRNRRLTARVSAVTSDPAQVDLTWQIVIGALAGVTPFVVAGIEFSKRIVAQRRCEVCGGSGLVLRDKKYFFRCPSCGGFLPWQSWKRFFIG